MQIVRNGLGWLRTGVGCAAALLAPAAAYAQGEVGVVGFQSAPYTVQGASSTRTLETVGGSRGPKGQGNMWDFAHFGSGGYNNRGFMRFYWWDWDVSRTGHGADIAGWTAAGSAMRPAGGWSQFGQGPYYLRFRMRVNAPILRHADNGQCDGDTQMKFFIWNSYTADGTDRVIMMLHDGAFGGGSETGETTLQLRAGVSGSYALARIPNHQWVHVQMAWRWGPESSGFQRIYVNNNNVSSPNAANNRFDDLDVYGLNDHWGHPSAPQGLDNQFFLGDIANTGSCVREDAQIDVSDFEIATQFDPNWASGGSPSTTIQAPRNLRIVPGDVSAAALPFGVLGFVLGVRRMRRRKE
jgi:hypothetical protein